MSLGGIGAICVDDRKQLNAFLYEQELIVFFASTGSAKNEMASLKLTYFVQQKLTIRKSR